MTGGANEDEESVEPGGQNEGVAMWRCHGYKCAFIMTDIEMQSHRYDVGCPKCGCSFKFFSDLNLKDLNTFAEEK